MRIQSQHAGHVATRLALVAALLSAAACGSSTPYVYRPERASVWVDGFPGARQPIPPEQPQGDVRVASFGVAEVAPPGGGAAIPALHVRMVVANNGEATAWQIDTREQQVFIQGEGRTGPLYVNTDAQGLPLVSVPARERRVLDFYFPLPSTIGDIDQLPRFDFLWQVQTGARLVADRTLFERREVGSEDTYTHVTLVAGWGPWWWYNPYYPTLVFVHHRPEVIVHDHGRPAGVHVVRPRHRVYVGRPPTRPSR